MSKRFIMLTACMLSMCIGAMAQGLDLSSVVTEMPSNVSYTAENDAEYPWTVADGAISIDNSMMPNKKESWVTMTVICAKPTRMVVDYNAKSYSSSDPLKIVAENHAFSYGYEASGNCVHYLEEGVNTVKIGYVRTYQYSSNTAAYNVAVSNIRFMDLDDAAIEINLSAAGNLGQEAIAALMETGQGQSLPDMKYLRLTGPMNSADWDAISKMTSLYYIDMEGTRVTDIPAQAFRQTALRYIKFPANLKTIGKSAFYDRYLRGNLRFPAT